MYNSIDPRTVISQSLSRPTPQQQKTNDLKQLREASREFETLFVVEMYKAMRKSVPESGLFEENMANDMYKEMLDMEMAKQTAAGPGIGLGESMYNQMAKLIEVKKY